MSGTYDDVAWLRLDEEAAGESEQGRAQAPETVERQVPIAVVEPEGNSRGGIVLLHESREFTGQLRNLMNALAAEGWTVVAPNLFHRATATPEGVFGTELFEDFDACFDWLTHRGVFPDCVGALGFDTAGTAAFLVATNRPIGAAVSVAAPGISAPLTEQAVALLTVAEQLQAPWLGLFGGEEATPVDEVDALREACSKALVASLVINYPGQLHRADKPGSEDDEEAELVDAQTRIFDWFDSHLR